MALNELKEDRYEQALILLTRSETLCGNNEQGKAITYNNLACYYRRYEI